MKTRLKDKYLRGETSPQEEQQLLCLLEAETQPTASDLAIKAMLKAAPPQAEDSWLTEDESDLYDQLMEQRNAKGRIRPLWASAGIGIAAVAVLAIGLTFTLFRTNREPLEAVAYIYGQEVTDEKEVVALMEGTMQGLLTAASENEVESQLSDIFGH